MSSQTPAAAGPRAYAMMRSHIWWIQATLKMPITPGWHGGRTAPQPPARTATPGRP
jgi:hypothetical protein